MDFTEVSELGLLFEFTGLKGARHSTKLMPEFDRDLLSTYNIDELMEMSPRYEPSFHIEDIGRKFSYAPLTLCVGKHPIVFKQSLSHYRCFPYNYHL